MINGCIAMYCKKCKGKEISGTDISEKKCKVCKKKFRGRFVNICPNCQATKKYCIKCGAPLKEEEI